MTKAIESIKKLVKENNLQKAVYEILIFVEETKNEDIKELYYSNFSDGETILEMIEYDNLTLVTDNNVEYNIYYEWYADNKEMVVNTINKTTVLKIIRNIEKLL